jgi:hypothetical protein
MTTQNETGFKTFQATAAAIEEFVRVTLDSNGLISKAAATDPGIGITQEYVAASGYGTVKLFTAPGSFMCQTASAVTRGAVMYAAANGEVDDSGTYRIPYVAGQAATAQGDIIELVPVDNMTTTVGTFLAGDIGTIAAAGNSQATGTAVVKMVTYVTAADDTKGVTLPAATAGAIFYIANTVTDKHLHIYPATDEYIGGVQNTGVTLAASQTAILVCYATGYWGICYVSA